MADNQISVDDMLSILDGGVATKPVDINVETMSVANEPAADISSVVNFLIFGESGRLFLSLEWLLCLDLL